MFFRAIRPRKGRSALHRTIRPRAVVLTIFNSGGVGVGASAADPKYKQYWCCRIEQVQWRIFRRRLPLITDLRQLDRLRPKSGQQLTSALLEGWPEVLLLIGSCRNVSSAGAAPSLSVKYW
jgi:hypothetical protein